jgi:hypothetical protein
MIGAALPWAAGARDGEGTGKGGHIKLEKTPPALVRVAVVEVEAVDAGFTLHPVISGIGRPVRHRVVAPGWQSLP